MVLPKSQHCFGDKHTEDAGSFADAGTFADAQLFLQEVKDKQLVKHHVIV